jgi:hypothetical protein
MTEARCFLGAGRVAIERRDLTRCPVGALELRAIRDLLKCGWTPEEIALDRNFSLRTCKRRIKELERLEAKLGKKGRGDD